MSLTHMTSHASPHSLFFGSPRWFLCGRTAPSVHKKKRLIAALVLEAHDILTSKRLHPLPALRVYFCGSDTPSPTLPSPSSPKSSASSPGAATTAVTRASNTGEAVKCEYALPVKRVRLASWAKHALPNVYDQYQCISTGFGPRLKRDLTDLDNMATVTLEQKDRQQQHHPMLVLPRSVFDVYGSVDFLCVWMCACGNSSVCA
jgi:hypothetical protein